MHRMDLSGISEGTMKAVVGFVGVARSGKDTAVSFLEEYGFARVSFADAVRDAALAIDPIVPFVDCYGFTEHYRLSQEVQNHGWEGAKSNPEVRRLLQVIGTEAGRDIHGKDCWANIAADKANKLLEEGNSVAFSDVRFESELSTIRRIAAWYFLPCKVIRIERHGVGPINGHASDKLDFKADLTIQNDGDIEQFRARVLEAVGIG